MPDSPDQWVRVTDAREALSSLHIRGDHAVAEGILNDSARSVPILPPGHIAISTEDAEIIGHYYGDCHPVGECPNDSEVCQAHARLSAALAVAKDTP